MSAMLMMHVSPCKTRTLTAYAWCVLWPAADLPHEGQVLFFHWLANYPGEKHGIWARAFNNTRQLDWQDPKSLDIHTEELRSSSQLKSAKVIRTLTQGGAEQHLLDQGQIRLIKEVRKVFFLLLTGFNQLHFSTTKHHGSVRTSAVC